MSTDWLRFRWNLDKSFETGRPILPPFVFRGAEADEAAVVANVIASALMMERAWNGTTTDIRSACERETATAFDRTPPACVVVQHGTRIIGASVLSLDPDAQSHLVSGPCILHEYRSRGLGSALLHQSLERLRAEGISTAFALARANSSVARFVYPKFGGEQELANRPPEKIAA